jgi:hypothetical protein
MGFPEEFTNDLTDLAEIDDVSYLWSNGLAKVGTVVRPGMLLIGKIGRKKVEAHAKDMNEFEMLIATPGERRDYWKQRAYDASVYAPSDLCGKVVAAYFQVDGRPRSFAQFEIPFGVAVLEIANLVETEGTREGYVNS